MLAWQMLHNHDSDLRHDNHWFAWENSQDHCLIQKILVVVTTKKKADAQI